MTALRLAFALALLAAPAAQAQQAPPDKVAPDGAAPATVTPAQDEAIGTIIYALVARRACGYLVSQTMLQDLARDAGVTFSTEAEGRATDTKTIEIGEKFSGAKKALECTRALDLYGPEGTALKELVKRREE